MNRKKTRIFLGGVVNYPNSQNINCSKIAKYIDKNKYEVHTLYFSDYPLNERYEGVILHKLPTKPFFVWFFAKYLIMLFSNCDVYYLPKMERSDILFALLHRRGKKTFISSIEGVITDKENNYAKYRKYQTQIMNNCFAISNCINESVKSYWGLSLTVIPLGVEPVNVNIDTETKAVKRIIWVGNFNSNKRPQLLIECAKSFPELEFVMIGDGPLRKALDYPNNVISLGKLSNDDVYAHMKNCDLLLMTSENEGAPKVIHEAASCGVPTLYINLNYSVDFVEDGYNGFVVKDIEQMKDRIKYLVDNPKDYLSMVTACLSTIELYCWPNLIDKYQDYFESVRKR